MIDAIIGIVAGVLLFGISGLGLVGIIVLWAEEEGESNV